MKLNLIIASVATLLILSTSIYTKAYYVCFLPSAAIAKLILWQMPPDSSIREVEEWLSSKQIPFKSYPVGFRRPENADDVLVGAKSIKATLGNCISIILFKRLVVATWAFDENNRLVDVRVRSYVDAL